MNVKRSGYGIIKIVLVIVLSSGLEWIKRYVNVISLVACIRPRNV